MEEQLNSYCELYWWNMGQKTLSFKGSLKSLLKEQNVTYTKRKTENEYIFDFIFKNPYGITFKVRSSVSDFAHYAKQFLQMEFVRMGDKTQLYVNCAWRPKVTVNF